MRKCPARANGPSSSELCLVPVLHAMEAEVNIKTSISSGRCRIFTRKDRLPPWPPPVPGKSPMRCKSPIPPRMHTALPAMRPCKMSPNPAEGRLFRRAKGFPVKVAMVRRKTGCAHIPAQIGLMLIAYLPGCVICKICMSAPTLVWPVIKPSPNRCSKPAIRN